jgi:hypothetical protein
MTLGWEKGNVTARLFASKKQKRNILTMPIFKKIGTENSLSLHIFLPLETLEAL